MVKFKPTKISQRLTIVYAMLFFVALAVVNFATLLSVNYYINQTSAHQLQMVSQTIVSDVKSLNDIPKIDLKKFSQIADNVDVSLIYNNRIIYNTGEQYTLKEAGGKNVGKVLKAESGENKIIYLIDTLSLNDGTKIVIQIVKDMDKEETYVHVLAGIMLFIDGF